MEVDRTFSPWSIGNPRIKWSGQDTLRGAKQRSTALEADALDRLGMVSLWLSGLALISLAVSVIGGIIGTPEEALIESAAETDFYRDIRRAS